MTAPIDDDCLLSDSDSDGLGAYLEDLLEDKLLHHTVEVSSKLCSPELSIVIKKSFNIWQTDVCCRRARSSKPLMAASLLERL